MSRSPLRRIVACVGGFLIAVGFACGTGAEQKAAAPSAAAGAAYTDHVTLGVSGCTGATPCVLTADPNIALRPPRSNLTWQIKGQPSNYSIEIEFAATNGVKGPFAKDPAATDNPAKGRYNNKTTRKDIIKTTVAGERTEDVAWKYSVILRDDKDNDVTTLDPIVIFK